MAVTTLRSPPDHLNYSMPVPRISQEGDVTVVSLHGEQDGSLVPSLRDALAGISGSGTDIVIDLRDVTFIDCAVFGAIIGARSELRDDGRSLSLRAPSRCVRRLMDLLRLEDLLDSTPATGRHL